VGAGVGAELSRTGAILELVGAGREDNAVHNPTQAHEPPERDMGANTHEDHRGKDEREIKELARPEANRIEPKQSLEKIVEIVLEL
jgi:hypothetical protein